MPLKDAENYVKEMRTFIHQGIGPEQTQAAVAGQKTGYASQKRQTNGYCKTAYNHGKHQLQGCNRHSSETSPQKPYQNLQIWKTRQPHHLTGSKKEHPHPKLKDNRTAHGQKQLGQKNIRRRTGIVIRWFQL